jgi:hypothetical protein
MLNEASGGGFWGATEVTGVTVGRTADIAQPTMGPTMAPTGRPLIARSIAQPAVLLRT